MPEQGQPIAKGFVPVLRYRNVAAAADFLCGAFGFERHHVIDDGAGRIIYAQLRSGQGLVMLVPVGQSDLDNLMVQPDLASGLETQVCYIAVADAATHHARAVAAGAEIVLALTGDDGGGAGYTCRDPEGHVWTFGTYDPSVAGPKVEPVRAPEPVAEVLAAAPEAPQRSWKVGLAAAMLAAAIATGGGLVVALRSYGSAHSVTPSAAVATARSAKAGDAVQQARAAPEAGPARTSEDVADVATARGELENERAEKETALQLLAAAKAEIEAVRSQQVAADTARREALIALENERALRINAEQLQQALVRQLEDVATQAAMDAKGAATATGDQAGAAATATGEPQRASSSESTPFGLSAGSAPPAVSTAVEPTSAAQAVGSQAADETKSAPSSQAQATPPESGAGETAAATSTSSADGSPASDAAVPSTSTAVANSVADPATAAEAPGTAVGVPATAAAEPLTNETGSVGTSSTAEATPATEARSASGDAEAAPRKAKQKAVKKEKEKEKAPAKPRTAKKSQPGSQQQWPYSSW